MPALYFIRAIADCDQKYYPETLNKFFLVNAPGAFVYVWKIVKAWLDPGVNYSLHWTRKCYLYFCFRQLPRFKLLVLTLKNLY